MLKNNHTIPLLKEYRIDKIKRSLECIDRYPFNRTKQRDCVLGLYPDKGKNLEHKEKSVFRGMVLPSLKELGLTLGQGQLIRASANGKLIVESQHINEDLHKQVLKVVIYELDKYRFNFLNLLRTFSSRNKKRFINELCVKIDGPSEKQRKERITHWLSILNQVGLIDYNLSSVFIDEDNLKRTLEDFNINQKSDVSFKKHLFNIYFELGKSSAGIVDIAELRERVGVKMLTEHEAILSEKQFDEMLKKVILETDEYIISLGRPMGAKDKLFECKGKYYRTIFIKKHKRE